MQDYGCSLEAIERNYGSVAEYQRVMYEEMEFDCEQGCYVPRKQYEPSEEELAREAKEQRLQNRKVEALCGTPSNWAINLKKELDRLAPAKEDYDSQTNDYYFACRQFSSKRTHLVVDGIKKEYGIILSKEVSPYNLPEGEFGVQIEDRNDSPVAHYSARGLTYEQFKTVFRDLRYLDKNPTMFFGRKGEHNTLILSNSSLGSLRYYDLWHYDLETVKAMDIEAIAINKAVYEANIDKVRLYDGQCIKSFFKRCAHYHYIGQISDDDDNEYCYCDIGSICSYDEMVANKKVVAA